MAGGSAGRSISMNFHPGDAWRRVPAYRHNLVTPGQRRQHHMTELAGKILVNNQKLHSADVHFSPLLS
jgi:hypothetical protein